MSADRILEMTQIVTDAVLAAQEENRRKGVPNVYCIHGTIIWQMPDGSILTKPPSEADLARFKH
jgi:hypothetical protein